MRVYEPSRDTSKIKDVLRNLYILRQAVDNQALSVDERVKMIDDIRRMIKVIYPE